MKTTSFLILLLSIVMLATAQTNEPFWLGADISSTTSLEARGTTFKNTNGVIRENTALMKELGLNAVRLRVWVNPKGGWSSKEDVLALARRAKALDMAIMINFHYSDWWADPGKQNIPAAWKDFNYEEMKTALANHTEETLNLLKHNGIDVRWVQVGNETSNGFLWEMGRASTNMAQYASLTTAGYDAVKKVYPDAIVIVQLDNGFDHALYNRIFDGLKQNGGKWDMIGMSVYPYWAMKSGKRTSAETVLAESIDNIKALSKKYECDIMIVEAGVEVSKPVEGKAFMDALLDAAINQTEGRCKGVFYWEPELEGNYPLGAFKNNSPTIIMDSYTEAAEKLNSLSRKEIILEKNWKFLKSDITGAEAVDFNDSKWQTVSIPHDWAIYGPFDENIDKYVTMIEQNGDKVPYTHTGRTGSLPYLGTGWYRLSLEIPAGYAHAELNFDGAMSEPVVYVNGKEAGRWAMGYNAFNIDITPYITEGKNTVAVRLQNIGESSRWYPGAGLYRPVTLTLTKETAIKTWGTTVTTPEVSEKFAIIDIKTELHNADKDTKVFYEILDSEKQPIGITTMVNAFNNGSAFAKIPMDNPKLWSPETPELYYLRTTVSKNGAVCDQTFTRFGIRYFSFDAANGFQLNGVSRKFQGVCLHHDLGPLGAAVNKAALRRQIRILKDMGCDAIRTAHNMPSSWQMEICDEMGMLVMAESFDMWKYPKVKNGYNRFFDDWAERDLTNLVNCHKNHPSIVMWSIGNEVPEQGSAAGAKIANRLQDLVHRLDPSRPVTQGLDRVDNAVKSGFAGVMDIVGLNYRTGRYEFAYENTPQGFILGSETASTVSSRGIYKFPVEEKKNAKYPDRQCSSYDLEACSWSNIPEDDWVLNDDKPWVIGEFVWTGFDYLGEPTPYDGSWPSRSSYFGIIDLAGIPKDRFYLYRSRWNKTENTLHILPHWNWEGREGEITPVYVYTNYPSVELFVNGVSQGKKSKDITSRLDRYRLRWNDVTYQAGEIKAVAYNEQGNPVAEKIVKTAGKPYGLKLETDRNKISADGNDLAYITVSVVDKDGNLCPTATNQLTFKTNGQGQYRCACNGDATSLEVFSRPTMKAFSGKLVVTLQSSEQAGNITLQVSGKGLKSETILIETVK
jgi:Arabinogalactan endo-1,4-beta-galactosidase